MPASDDATAAPAPAPASAPAGLPGVDRVPPLLLLLTGITSTQFGAGLAATLFEDLGPGGAALLRLALAALVLGILVRPSLRGRSPQALRAALLFGLTLGVMNLAFYESIDRIPLGIAVTVEFAGPLAVAVFTSRRRQDLVWAAIAAVAIVLLADPSGGGADALGLGLAVVAGACWAGYILMARHTGQLFAGADGLAMAMAIAVVVPLVPGLIDGGDQLVKPHFLVLGLAIALASSVIPYTLETEALRKMPTSVFGVLMSLEPAVAALAGLVILGQGLRGIDLVAIALVVLASAGVSRRAPVMVDA